ncbi:hypothetical protein VTN96DRAFT_7639 [Rasamsonia emersonii]
MPGDGSTLMDLSGWERVRRTWRICTLFCEKRKVTLAVFTRQLKCSSGKVRAQRSLISSWSHATSLTGLHVFYMEKWHSLCGQ